MVYGLPRYPAFLTTSIITGFPDSGGVLKPLFPISVDEVGSADVLPLILLLLSSSFQSRNDSFDCSPIRSGSLQYKMIDLIYNVILQYIYICNILLCSGISQQPLSIIFVRIILTRFFYQAISTKPRSGLPHCFCSSSV